MGGWNWTEWTEFDGMEEWTEWKNRCTVFGRIRERWKRGVFEALGIPRFAVLRGVTWYCKGIVRSTVLRTPYNVPEFAEITYKYNAGPTYGVLLSGTLTQLGYTCR